MKATILVTLILTLLAASNDNITNLDNVDESTRLASVSALATRGNAEAVEPLLKRLSIEKNDQVHAAILRALGTIGDRRVIPVLRKYYWQPQTSGEAADALFQAGDRDYVGEANRWRRILAVWIPLGFLILIALPAVLFAKDRSREIFRISLAAANGAIGFMLGFFLFFIGSLLNAPWHHNGFNPEWAGIAYIAIAMIYGFFSGFFASLAPFLQVRNWRPLANAISVSVACLLLSPIVLTSMTKVFAQSNAPTSSPFVDLLSSTHSGINVLFPFLTGLFMAALAVFLCAWAVSVPLKRLQYDGSFSLRQFVMVVLIMGVLFLLHDPIAQWILSKQPY